MPKRGERLAWQVRYEWDSGVKGAQSFASEWLANHRADEIRHSAETQNRTVTVTVKER
jgi:hypothetical protein